MTNIVGDLLFMREGKATHAALLIESNERYYDYFVFDGRGEGRYITKRSVPLTVTRHDALIHPFHSQINPI